MDGEASLEGRLRYVEQLSHQLTRQMKAMKQLVSTEVDELKKSLQQQADEMRQVLIQQDRLYQEQIRRLESRVEQLAEFAMHLAQSKNLAGTMGGRPGDAAAALTPQKAAHSPHASSPHHPSYPLSGGQPASIQHVGGYGARGHESDDEDADARASGTGPVIDKWRAKIGTVYRHYAETASRALHPTMTLAQFTKFTKDCGLCNSSAGAGSTVAVNAYLPPPELLWMNVLRRLPHERRKRRGAAANQGNFAFERVQELSEEQFPHALVILAEEQYGRREDMEPGAVVELFLVNDIFPVTDRRIAAAQQQKAQERDRRTTPLAAKSIEDYYDNKDVSDAFKEYRTKLRNSFQLYVTKHHSIYRKSENLSLQGFSDLLRDHGLLPHITLKAMREIFLSVVQGLDAMRDDSPGRGGRRDEELEIDTKGFYLALRHVAEHVYGDRALVEKFPTPEARLRKLLAKMYLLSHG